MTDRGTAARRTEGATAIEETTGRRGGDGTATGATGIATTSAGRVALRRRAGLTGTGAIVLAGRRLLTSVAGMMSSMAGVEVPGTTVGIFSVTSSELSLFGPLFPPF